MHSSNKASQNKQIIIWLICCSLSIMVMVFLGGITRLTNSGLSIVEWRPITGIIPPLSENDWLSEFELYKNFPEYQKINLTISFSEFKFIYLLEFVHRFAARVTGLIFILPLSYFLYAKSLTNSVKNSVFLVIFLGFIQAYLGWYMVKSGLYHKPTVSHYRLTIHLIMAFSIFSIIFWQVCNLIFKPDDIENQEIDNLSNIYRKCFILLLMIIVQIFFGGLVAGLKAGYIYNDFPLMGGKFIHPEIFKDKNPLNNPVFVQFFHRMTGIIILVFSIYLHIYIKYNNNMRKILVTNKLFLLIVAIQFVSGILTLIYVVPINLAAFHQMNSMILLGILVYLINFLFNTRKFLCHIRNISKKPSII